jgi:cyclin-dependent kinase
MWSVGTIFAEMVMRGNPLFPGDSEIDQIFKIFRSVLLFYIPFTYVLVMGWLIGGDCYFNRVMGTPSERTWPGVSQMPDYKETFPQWSAQDLRMVVSTLDESGLDLLRVSLLLLFIYLFLEWIH